MDARYDIAGLGNALVDALVRLENDTVISDLGLTRGQMHPVDDTRWHQCLSAVEDKGVDLQTGGSCANTLATLGLLGARTLYCGQVGDDRLGRVYQEQLEEACGGHSLFTSKDLPTGKCLSLISADAERTMITDLGAAIQLPGLGDFADDLRQSSLFHLTAYLFLGEPMCERAMEAIAVANQGQIPVSLDIADPFVVSQQRDHIWYVLEEFTDIVFLNQEEARALCETDPEQALHKLAECVETVVLKLGAQGSLIHTQGRTYRCNVVPVTPVDTTGAGDSYAAGYLFGLVRGWGPQACGDLGSRVAAHTVQQVGAVVRNREVLAAQVAATQSEA